MRKPKWGKVLVFFFCVMAFVGFGVGAEGGDQCFQSGVAVKRPGMVGEGGFEVEASRLPVSLHLIALEGGKSFLHLLHSLHFRVGPRSPHWIW